MVYTDGDEGSMTEVRFEKCKDGVSLYRDESVQSKISEEVDEPCSPPLPKSKTNEIFTLSEMISSMSGMRMNDQRCSLTKV